MKDDVSDTIETLQGAMEEADHLKRENAKLRRVNKKLREGIATLIKELRRLKNEQDREYSYSFGGGWRQAFEQEADEFEELRPEEVDEQMMKIQQILEGDMDE